MSNVISTDPLSQLFYVTHYEALHKIRIILPPPLEDTAEGVARRDTAVIEQIAQLIPAGAPETELAAKFVGASEFAFGCMREACALRDDPATREKALAQAARSGREARGYLASLLRLQTMRMKREATRAGAELADVMETNARNFLRVAQAEPPRLRARASPGGAPAPAAASDVAPEEERPAAPGAAAPHDASPPEPLVREAVVAPGEPRAEAAAVEPGAPPGPLPQLVPVPFVAPDQAARRRTGPRRSGHDDGWPKPDWVAEAEHYAKVYPDRAQLIRRLGGLPNPCLFGPPEQALVRAIVTGSSPALLALDDLAADGAQPQRRFA